VGARAKPGAGRKRIASSALASVFGIDLEAAPSPRKRGK
jgi:hypothetical protein